MPPPFATNLRGPALRDTIVVVEDESIDASMAQAVKAAIEQFIGRLAPGTASALSPFRAAA